jgi:hypothetical protein
MDSVSVWTILSIIAVVALILFWGGGPNPVWGALTLGFIGGLIAAGIYAYIGHGFLWSIVGKWCVVFVVVTFTEEIVRGAWKRFRR